MDIRVQIERQRIKYIVSSYQLAGNETEAFDRALELLLNHYPLPLIELALVETLVDRWLQVPFIRGCQFLDQAHKQLQIWEEQSLQNEPAARLCISTVLPDQFQQITGLDPAPIFGSKPGSNLSVSQPSVRS